MHSLVKNIISSGKCLMSYRHCILRDTVKCSNQKYDKLIN